MNDIPEAVRENPDPPESASSPRSKWLLIGGISLGVIVLSALTITLLASANLQNPSSTRVVESVIPPDEEETPDNLLGHLPYSEAPESDLKAVSNDGRIKLRSAAAEKFLQMQKAARADGVILAPLSGFRSVEEQKPIFFEVAQERNQDVSSRAEVSAPPGYSEHHTGYAIDIGDGRNPSSNLRTDFERTRAFAWLQENASRYSFELSYPEDNLQGISYEPWHWRFVGDRHSLETFYRARNLNEPLQPTDE